MTAKKKAVVKRARQSIGDLYMLGLMSQAEYNRAIRRWLKWALGGK